MKNTALTPSALQLAYKKQKREQEEKDKKAHEAELTGFLASIGIFHERPKMMSAHTGNVPRINQQYANENGSARVIEGGASAN